MSREVEGEEGDEPLSSTRAEGLLQTDTVRMFAQRVCFATVGYQTLPLLPSRIAGTVYCISTHFHSLPVRLSMLWVKRQQRSKPRGG